MSSHTPVGLLLGLASSIMVIASPNQNIKICSYIALGLGLGVVVSSQIGDSESEKKVINLQKTVEIVDNQRRQIGKEKEKLIIDSNQKIESLEADITVLRNENKQTHFLANSLKSKISELESDIKLSRNELDNELKALRQQHYSDLENLNQKHEFSLREISQFSTSSGFEIAQKTYDTQFQKLDGLVTGYKRNYPDLFEFFDNLESEIDQIKSRSIAELENYESVKSLQSLIDDGLRIQERIISKCSDIKIKALTTVTRYLNDLIKDSVGLSEYQKHLENLTQQAKTVIEAKELQTKEVALKWVESNELTQQRYENEFNETLNTGKHLVTRNQELVAEIEQLKRPLTWSLATRQDLQIGNIIITYFDTLGMILDRAKAEFDHWQSTLSFHIDRNCRTITPGELEPHSEKLQQLAHTLSPIKFGWNAEEGLMTAWLHLASKPLKPTAETDINKIWRTADKFQSTVKNWSRVRVTGGSESGKSPTAENLAVCILLSRGGNATLFNPQADSVKNYWSIPQVGNSHEDSVQGISELADTVNEKHNDRSHFKLTIFDEIDSTMVSVEKKSQAEIGQNISTIIKQVSHQNLGVIFIGQNANASQYPGMDRSDWNSAVNLHIGSNSYDAITNSNQITPDEQKRLKTQADKLTEFCQEKNTELGLEKTNPQAYRFAVVLGDGKPYFIQLPDFGEYTYDLVQSQIKCPHCDSGNIISKGKNRRQCKDCDKSFSV